MEQQNSRWIAIGLMLFALFFGAGNLIFPATMGQSAGENYLWALVGFCVTGVGLPLLAVMAMGYSGCKDLQEAAGRVHPWYGLFYTIVSYMAIGPCFAIPRTGTVSFEIAVRPFMDPEWVDSALPIFLVFFFWLTYWLAATPQKLVDRIGKILTPALVLTIAALIVKSIVTPMGVPQAPVAPYETALSASLQGVLDGYNTLDAIAAFVFAMLVISFVRSSGIHEPKKVAIEVYKSGAVAVIILALIYAFIAKIGAESVAAIGMQETGAPVLAESAKLLFSHAGALLLSVIVLLACLTTSIGLVTCCATYFMELTGKLAYRTWCALFCVVSYLIGLFGLKTIIVSTIPVLMFIYPLIVALIFLLFLDKFFGGRQCVYAWTTGLTFIMAAVSGLQTAGVNLGAVDTFFKAYIPLYGVGMGWIGFALAGFVIGFVQSKLCPAK